MLQERLTEKERQIQMQQREIENNRRQIEQLRQMMMERYGANAAK